MHEVRISSRYAESVLDIAEEQNSAERLKEDMLLFKETYEGSRELRVMLSNPIIHSSKKAVILDRLFGKQFLDLSKKFVNLVCKKNREGLLYDIAWRVIEIYNEKAGIVTASVRTAAPLSGELRNRLIEASQRISGKRVELEEKVEPKLIGGFVLRVGDRQVDSSIAGQLRQIERSFSESL